MEEKSSSMWLVLLIAVLVVVALSPFVMMRMMGVRVRLLRYGMGPRMMGFGFVRPFMFLVQLGFVVLIVLGLYYLLSGQGRGRHALRILKVRYARGEITSEQYEKMKRDLEEHY